MGLSLGIVQTILTDGLGMQPVVVKFVLHSSPKETNQMQVAHNMVEYTNADLNFMKEIITRDETCIYGYDPETNTQSSQWKQQIVQRRHSK